MSAFKKILVVEDDVITRKIITRGVEDLGYVAIQSCDGRQAWETLWENSDICLIITDMMMPDMDGRELIQIVRGNQQFSGIPIIIVSGVLTPKDVESLLKLPPCRFLGKPVIMKDLKETIESMLAEK
jgi:CheY-like chemotaxis protein